MLRRRTIPILLALIIVALHRVSAAPSAPSKDEPPNFFTASVRGDVLYAPIPAPPHEGRWGRPRGAGVAWVEIDPATGLVTNAYMHVSTDSRHLDETIVHAIRKWRFKPGTVTRIQVPLAYAYADGRIPDLKTKQSMSDALAPFLGAGVVSEAPIPQYPGWPINTKRPRQGKGVYELAVDSKGNVRGVKVLQSSGDTLFDRSAKATLHDWQFTRGPLTVELPLSFVLTAESYRVDIAR